MPVSYLTSALAESVNAYTNTCVVESAEHQNDHGGVSMKFLALLTAPLSYLPFSTSTPGKTENAKTQAVSRVKKSKPEKKANSVQLRPYRGTSIVFKDCACDAVKAIGNRRFLHAEGDTPLLPLAACDASTCKCTYIHHDDRRDDDDDRRHIAALRTELYEDSGNTNRRLEKRGRRESDF